jgi:WD40 repeat protein
MLVLKGLKVGLRALAFSADGMKLAVGGQHVVQVWNLRTNHVSREFSIGTRVLAVMWLDPTRVVARRDLTLMTLDLGTREFDPNQPPSKLKPVWQIAPSADGRSLAVGYDSRVARLPLPRCEPKRWEVPIVVPGPHGNPASMAWSGDGRAVGVGLQNGQVKVFDAASGSEVATRGEPGGATVNGVALSPDARAVAWCACTRLHFQRDGLHVEHALGRTHFQGVAFHPSGGFFATANGDGKVDYWDARTGQRHASYDWGVGKLNAVVFDAAGDRAACCSDGGEIVIWDVDR